MFMFRKRRNSLTRRLEKARKRRGDETRRSSEDEAKRLLKRLNCDQLDILCRAVESRGMDASNNCILVLPENQPHVLCCQTWRWPEVRESGQLRRLPACSSAADPVYICCNPFHWSRICFPDSPPPPPYSRFAMERLKPEDRAPSEVPIVCRDTYAGSLTTDGEDSLMNPSMEWCKLAYWELTQRIGPPFPVEGASVNIFDDDPYGDGLCLKTLSRSCPPSPESVRRTRSKIGLGVTLSREDDGVWVYNRSQNPIFVNSFTLDDSQLSSMSPIKVPSEHCLCVFDPIKAAYQNYTWNFPKFYGPVDRNSVTISFVKGWGQKYKRQQITSCPCWIEILLAPCR